MAGLKGDGELGGRVYLWVLGRGRGLLTGKGSREKMFRWLQTDRALIDEVGYVVAETRAMGLKKKAADKPGGTRVVVAVLIARRQVEPHADPARRLVVVPHVPRSPPEV